MHPHRQLFIVAVLTLGVMARAATYRSPLFDFHAWRQADTAAIARNFVEERFNPLYPQVDFRGGRAEGYVETGLELYAFVVATLARVVGFSPVIGRLVNVVLFPLTALLLYRFVRLRYGDAEGLVALFIYSLGLPLTMFMDRAFMNEALLALLSVLCLWSAQKYCERPGSRHLVTLLFGCATIAVVKPTYLIVAAPVAALFVERFGRAGWLRPELWLVGAVTVICGALWFWHAHRLHEMTGLSFGLDNKFMSGESLTWADYPRILGRRLLKDILGPVGVLFAPIGLVVAVRLKKRAELWGVLAFALYLLVVAAGNFHHNYYQLPIVPIGTVLTSVGIMAAVRRVSSRYAWTPEKRLAACAAILWVAAASTFARNVSAHNWYEIDHAKRRLCEDLQPRLLPTDRVVFVNESNPDVLFCLGRKGWLLGTPAVTVEDLRKLSEEGGSVVVTRRPDPLSARLDQAAQPLLETPDFVVHRWPSAAVR
jgi:4-amino-4-deoxy-L-arabinose transferase-like glycosyltransferase